MIIRHMFIIVPKFGKQDSYMTRHMLPIPSPRPIVWILTIRGREPWAPYYKSTFLLDVFYDGAPIIRGASAIVDKVDPYIDRAKLYLMSSF